MPQALTVGVDARALVPAVTGIGVYCRSVLRGLAADPEWQPLALAHAPITGLADDAGIEKSVVPTASGVVWQQRRLNRQLMDHRCDLLWSPIFTLPRSPSVPSVITVHDLTAWLFPKTHRLKVRASLKPFLGASVRSARRIITPSRATADDLAGRFPEARGKTVVIPHGVDEGFKPATQLEISATRARLGLPEGYLLYSGTVEPRKNLDGVLDAWVELRREGVAPPLVVVGGVGWKADSILERMRQLQELGLVWLGRLPRQEQIEVMQAATAMVFVSLYEGFGLPALEAMACRVPVIASAGSSLPEVVGETGILVDPHDRGEIAGAMRRLVADPNTREELAQQAHQRSRDFSWTKSVAAHITVFHEALASQPTSASAVAE